MSTDTLLKLANKFQQKLAQQMPTAQTPVGDPTGEHAMGPDAFKQFKKPNPEVVLTSLMQKAVASGRALTQAELNQIQAAISEVLKRFNSMPGPKRV